MRGRDERGIRLVTGLTPGILVPRKSTSFGITNPGASSISQWPAPGTIALCTSVPISWACSTRKSPRPLLASDHEHRHRQRLRRVLVEFLAVLVERAEVLHARADVIRVARTRPRRSCDPPPGSTWPDPRRSRSRNARDRSARVPARAPAASCRRKEVPLIANQPARVHSPTPGRNPSSSAMLFTSLGNCTAYAYATRPMS